MHLSKVNALIMQNGPFKSVILLYTVYYIIR